MPEVQHCTVSVLWLFVFLETFSQVIHNLLQNYRTNDKSLPPSLASKNIHTVLQHHVSRERTKCLC